MIITNTYCSDKRGSTYCSEVALSSHQLPSRDYRYPSIFDPKGVLSIDAATGTKDMR